MSDNKNSNKNFETAIVKLDFLRGDEEHFKDAVSKLNDKLNETIENTETVQLAKEQKSK